MKVTIVFNPEFEIDMRKQFGSFSNPLVIRGVVKVCTKNGYLHTTIWDERRFNMKNISQVYVESDDRDEDDGK